VLAGGSGSRLYPATRSVSKQLLPVYDKPMVFYPLSILMLAGIRDVLIVAAENERARFERLLGDGSRFGISIGYAGQTRPGGLVDALLAGAGFVGTDPCAAVLGDNLFYGTDLRPKLARAAGRTTGATVFATEVGDPRSYGVLELDSGGRPVSIEEKPATPRSRLAVTGLYFYDGCAIERARSLSPASNGEVEITDLNRVYLEAGALHVETLGRGTTWLDAGTPRSLLAASNFVETVQDRQGRKICCPEEIGFRLGDLDAGDLERIAKPIATSEYGRYLLAVAGED
jgi:glucose-1-phosphate thymidylyltransferase